MSGIDFFSLHPTSIKAYKRVRYFPYDNHLDQRCSWDDNLSTMIMHSKEYITLKRMCMSTQVKCTRLCLWLLHLQLLSLFYVTLQYLSRYFTMKTEVERQGSMYHTYLYNRDDTRLFSNYYIMKRKKNEKDCWTFRITLSFFFLSSPFFLIC